MKMYHLVEAESLWALSQKGAVNLPQVKELQDKLRAAGHNPGPSDGWYGKNTANAVRAYQQANGLKVDGDAGPQTLASLGMAGANNTLPRETPPEETPPAPAPRQTATEPKDQPAASAPTRREPEQTTTTTTTPTEPESEPTSRTQPSSSGVPFSNLAVSGTITLPSQLNARSMRNAINQISEIDIRLTDYVRGYGSNAPMVDVEVDVSNYNLDYTQRQRVGRNILDFLQEKFVSSNDMELEVRVDDTESRYLVTRTTIFIDADASAPTRREPEQTTTTTTTPTEPESEPAQTDTESEVTTQEKITSIGTGLDPQSILALFGAIEQGSAKYWTGGLRIDSQNNDAVIVFGSRESTLSDDQLERVGLPRVTYSTYAFSIKKNRGYRLSGRVDYDDIQKAYNAFTNASVTSQTYALQSGSSQALRRQKIMNWIKSYTPAKEDLERIRSQRESINRLSNLAGIK